MSNVIRIALPGYNALTDTNLDHFALRSDEDNVLIKEFTRGSVTLGPGSNQNITHNLGYIPFFLVYVQDSINFSSGTWVMLGNINIFAPYAAAANTTILNILNNSGDTFTFKYFIFYDNLNDNTAPSIIETSPLFKVAKSGVNALVSKNPNDYIFHSQLNTFKIVHQGSHDVSIVSGTANYSFAHNSPLSSTSCMLIFVKFPDGKVTLVGNNGTNSYDRNRSLNSMTFDNTNINLNYGFVASNYTLHVSWLIFEADL